MAVFQPGYDAFAIADNTHDTDSVCGIIVVALARFSCMAARGKAVGLDSGQCRITHCLVCNFGFLRRSVAYQLSLAFAGIFSFGCRAAFLACEIFPAVEQENIPAAGSDRFFRCRNKLYLFGDSRFPREIDCAVRQEDLSR